MASKIIFGTDGWRGFIAEDYTFENVRRCAQGFAEYLHKLGKKVSGLLSGTINASCRKTFPWL